MLIEPLLVKQIEGADQVGNGNICLVKGLLYRDHHPGLRPAHVFFLRQGPVAYHQINKAVAKTDDIDFRLWVIKDSLNPSQNSQKAELSS